MNVYACALHVCVCPHAQPRLYLEPHVHTLPDYLCNVHAACGRCLVPLLRLRDMLSTSGFVNDVMIAWPRIGDAIK